MNNCLLIDNKKIYTPLYDIIKDMQNELRNGKLAIVKPPVGANVRVQCVNSEHKGGHEARPSASVYIGETTDIVRYGTYSCFTCGTVCSFEHFVALAFDESDNWAKQWLIERYAEIDTDTAQFDLPPILLPKARSQHDLIDRTYLSTLEDYHPYMAQRKLTKDIVNQFGIKYEPRTQCLVFPVEDERGSLTLLTRRSVIDKTFIIDKNAEKPLYLLGYVMKHNITEVLISEAQIDSLTSWVYGMPAIASMGNISDHQIQLLKKSGIRILYTMFDNDDTGRRLTAKVMNAVNNIMVIPVPIIYPGKKDINMLTREEFWNCIKNAQNNLVL